MAWEARLGLKLQVRAREFQEAHHRLNGLGSPFGFETRNSTTGLSVASRAKWPGKPVWV